MILTHQSRYQLNIGVEFMMKSNIIFKFYLLLMIKVYMIKLGWCTIESSFCNCKQSIVMGVKAHCLCWKCKTKICESLLWPSPWVYDQNWNIAREVGWKSVLKFITNPQVWECKRVSFITPKWITIVGVGSFELFQNFGVAKSCSNWAFYRLLERFWRI
jgi:hypothetical protein